MFRRLLILGVILGLSLAIRGFSSPPGAIEAASTPTWIQKSIPPARQYAAMAYDASTGNALVFGGLGTSENYLNDTWGWSSNGGWTQFNPASSPSARGYANMAYDAATGKVILFGGIGNPGSGGCSSYYCNDTWSWDGSNWTQVISPGCDSFCPGSPGARGAAGMAYDAATGTIVLFAGSDDGGIRDDTWIWDGSAWTRVVTTPDQCGGAFEICPNSPPDKTAPGMAYDGNGHVILFGGQGACTPGGVASCNDTWQWDGTAWTQLISPGCGNTCPNSPSGRNYVSMDYDAATSSIVLFGGCCNGADDFGDTWSWNAGAWTQQNPATSPPARAYASMSYDVAGTMLILGGQGACAGVPCSDAWTWNGTTWSQLGSPSARWYGSMSYDAATGKVILFGGCSDGACNNPLNDTWSYDTYGWHQLNPASSPPARGEQSMVYDAAMGKILLFGGNNSAGGPLGDTWTWDGNNWTRLNPATSPPARSDVGMAYDAATQKVILFGGFTNTNNGGITWGDTWSWDGNSSTWTDLDPLANAPANRLAPGMTYDTATGTIILFGGSCNCVSGSYFNDTWSWNGSAWTQLGTASSPFPRCCASMDYDAATGTVILFGGYGEDNHGNLVPLSDTWSFDGTNWTQLISPGCGGYQNDCPNSPSPRSGQYMAYDPLFGIPLLFGGGYGFICFTSNCSPITILGDTWLLSPNAQPSVTSVSPNSGPPAGGTSVTIGGSNLALTGYTTTVAFGGIPATNVNCTATSCTATSPANLASSTVDVTVTLGGQTSTTNAADRFTYLGTPTVTAVSPSSGPASGGFIVKISGSSFSLNSGATTFKFGSNAATNVSCFGTATCKATVPAGSGTVDVTATVAALTSAASAADHFSYVALPTWFQQSPQFVPPAREQPSMAYDAATSTVILFGGYGNCPCTDTWSWDGNNWTQLNPATNPSVRTNASMAYDSAHQKIILFGGCANNTPGSCSAQNDTWSWDGTNWTQLSPSASPPARDFASMAYDAATQTMILFGGCSDPYCASPLGDTWQWDGTNWTQLNPALSPSVRGQANMAFDAANGLAVLFGGYPTAVCGGYCGDTWVWNGSNWAQVFPTASPPARGAAQMAYDAATSTAVLFGGCIAANYSMYLNDTWLWNGGNWTQQSAAVSPIGRSNAGFAYDTAAGHAVVFGGLGCPNGTCTYISDTWTWWPASPSGPNPPTVNAISPVIGPPAGGTTVTITGSGFSGVTAVKFGSTAGTNVSCASTTSCSATSPAGTTGTVDVLVTAAGGTSVVSTADRFAYFKLGDVNGDGSVTSVDALCVLRMVAGLPGTAACPIPPPGNPIIASGETSGPTAVDALCILRGVAGLPATAKCPLITAPVAGPALTPSPSPNNGRGESPSAPPPTSGEAAAPSSGTGAGARGGEPQGGQDEGQAIRSPERGGTTTVQVRSNVSKAKIGAWTVDVSYDPKARRPEGCNSDVGSVCNLALDDHMVRITGASASGIAGDSLLATIRFAAAGNAAGSSRVRATTLTLTDPSGGKVGAGAAITVTVDEGPP